MTDFQILLVLVVGSPLWLLATAIAWNWYGLWWFLSLLKLPDLVGGPLALILMLTGMPFLLMSQWSNVSVAYLWCTHINFEKLRVGSSNIEIERRKSSSVVPWNKVRSVNEKSEPPVHSYSICLNDGTVLYLNTFTNVEELLVQADKKGILVRGNS